MNGGFKMNNYKNLVEGIYDNIIKKYNLNIIPIDDSEVFLVGIGFALAVCISLEGADIYYIMPDEKATLIQYRLSNSLQDRFTVEDRKCYGKPSTNDERIIGELKVFASGLFNHWDELLKGDKIWLKKHKGRELKVNMVTTQILASIFQNQNF